MLLNFGATVDIKNDEGQTPLMTIKLKKGRERMREILCQYGVNECLSSDQIPLDKEIHYADGLTNAVRLPKKEDSLYYII